MTYRAKEALHMEGDNSLNDTESDDVLSQCAKEAEESLNVSPDDCHDQAVLSTSTLDKSPDATSGENVEEDEILHKDSPIIVLTAPTGKAANLIGQRAKLPSFTLHSVVMSYYNWKYAKPPKDGEKDSWKFHRVQALVVDECSLVSVCIFSNMLQALMKESKLKRIVLLGDVHQLLSIDAGNFLSDIYHALDKFGLSVKLLKNHRSEAQLIVDNANSIQHKQMPIFDPSMNFHLRKLSDNDGNGKIYNN